MKQYYDLGLHPEQKDNAIYSLAAAMAKGEIAILPTDTVYGISAAVDKPHALRKIYRVKGRPYSLPLPIQLAGVDNLRDIIDPIGPQAGWAMLLAERFWPGALTIICNARCRLDPILTPGRKVGVRVSANDIVRKIAANLGGYLAMTSANISGQPESIAWQNLDASLRDAVAYGIKLDLEGETTTSTVLDLTHHSGACFRRIGAVKPEDIEGIVPLRPDE